MYKNQISRLRKKFLNAFDEGDILKALLTGERILKIYEDNNGVETLYFVDDAYNLACAYSFEGRYLKSTELYEKAAKIIEKLQGQNLEYSNIVTNLAIDINLMGRHEEAVTLFESVYELRKNILSTEHPDYIDILLNLGSAYFDVDEFDVALKYHKEALSIRKNKDLSYADNLNLIGYDYEEQNEFEKASEYFEKALEIIKNITGSRSEEYLKNLYYLAAIYDKAKNYEESKNCYEKSVELIKIIVGEGHPYYADSLNNLANSYLNCGNDNKAITLKMKALNIIKNIVGKNHLYYASNLKSIADIYFKKGDFKRAKSMYEDILEINSSIIGKNNFEYIRDVLLLSEIFISEKNFEASIALISDALIDAKDNDCLATLLNLNLAYIYYTLENGEKLSETYINLNKLDHAITFDRMLDVSKNWNDVIEKILSKELNRNDFNFWNENNETRDTKE